MSDLEERLQRLVESDMCGAINAEQHREELKGIAGHLVKTEIRDKSRFFKALSDEKRLSIVKLLSVRDMCICELMIALEMSQPNLSHHIKILENAGIVERLKRGKWVFCTLSDEALVKRIESLGLL
jgi:ArsR family transcriptional regulator